MGHEPEIDDAYTSRIELFKMKKLPKGKKIPGVRDKMKDEERAIILMYLAIKYHNIKYEKGIFEKDTNYLHDKIEEIDNV